MTKEWIVEPYQGYWPIKVAVTNLNKICRKLLDKAIVPFTKHVALVVEWHLNSVSIAYYLLKTTSKGGEKKDETSILPKGTSTLQVDNNDWSIRAINRERSPMYRDLIERERKKKLCNIDKSLTLYSHLRANVSQTFPRKVKWSRIDLIFYKFNLCYCFFLSPH